MTIEINNLPPVPPGSAETGNSSGVKRNEQQTSLTPTAQTLRDLEARVADLPEVDQDRVRAIKDAIANGTFRIDDDRIAARLIGMERALKDIG